MVMLDKHMEFVMYCLGSNIVGLAWWDDPINVSHLQEECIVGLHEIPSQSILLGDFEHDSEHQLLSPGESKVRRQLPK